MVAAGFAGGQARVWAVDDDQVAVAAVGSDLRAGCSYRCLVML